jgi:uncharacterized protein
MREIKEKIVVFYDDDADGFGGAWAAWKRFGARAKYIPITVRGGETLIALKNKKIYFIDAIFSEAAVRRLMKDNCVVIIDHHKGRKDFLKEADAFSYDVKHSSCVLAWHYFFPKERVPKILKYVEDMDLWRFRLPKTREIIAVIDSHSHNFRKWNLIANRLESAWERKEFVKEGATIVRYEDKIINALLVSNAQLVSFEGKRVLALNTPVLHSDTGHQMAEKQPPFAVVWYRKGDYWKVSLRSVGRFDVSKIAEKFGGGGHRNAAGFTIPGNKKLPWKFLEAQSEKRKV